MAGTSKYSVEIYDVNGELLADLAVRARNRKVKLTRNRTYSCQWNIDIKDLEDYAAKSHLDPTTIISSGQSQIKIKRGSRYLFGGELQKDDGTLDIDSQDMTLTGVGWFEYFGDRLLDQSYVYTGVDKGAIMWDLINNAQLITNGNYNVTKGNLAPSSVITQTFDAEKNIKDILTQLAATFQGPDFEFTHDKVFNTFYPMGAVQPSIEFRYPGNVTKLKVTNDASKIANYVLAKAGGTGVAALNSDTIVQDTSVQAGYRLRQQAVSYNDIFDSGVLSAAALEFLRLNKLPQQLVQLTVDGSQRPFLGDYWLGDKVPLIVSSAFSTYNKLSGNYYMIDDIDLTVDENDAETIVITGVKY